jgi:hypothetical protein
MGKIKAFLIVSHYLISGSGFGSDESYSLNKIQYNLENRFLSGINLVHISHKESRTLLIRINRGGEPPGYAENLDNWCFL